MHGRCEGTPKFGGVQLSFSDEVMADADVGPEVNQVVPCTCSITACRVFRSSVQGITIDAEIRRLQRFSQFRQLTYRDEQCIGLLTSIFALSNITPTPLIISPSIEDTIQSYILETSRINTLVSLWPHLELASASRGYRC